MVNRCVVVFFDIYMKWYRDMMYVIKGPICYVQRMHLLWRHNACSNPMRERCIYKVDGDTMHVHRTNPVGKCICTIKDQFLGEKISEQ